jgi:capsular exopolysaccharide synthesis family protein
LVLGLGLMFLREALNTRVRTAAEVHERLDLPQLGRLPEPPRRFRGQNQLLMLAEPHSPAAEGFRILATNLDFVNLERGARAIMFTSATHSEGKSTTIANLAVALARTGRRIVLADLDLRKPALADLFSLGEQPGLTSVALGRIQLDEALVPIPLVDMSGADTAAPSDAVTQGVLEVLPVGPPPPNPAEFAGSHALAAILAELEKRAELVLIDSPPMLDLSDAMALTSRVDALVVVARLPSTRRATLQELHRVLAAAPITKLGFVATGTTSDGETYGAYGYGRRATDDPRTRWETTAH